MDGKLVLKIARDAIETYVKTSRRIATPSKYPSEMKEKRGVFVTIFTKPKELRGCIGFPYPQEPLIDGLIEAAIDACNDPRFLPLSESELRDIWIEVSVLTEPKQLTASGPGGLLAALRPEVDGLIIQKGSRSALYLPQVWEEIPKKEDFLSSLCLKAGLDTDDWKAPSARFCTFQVESFDECRA